MGIKIPPIYLFSLTPAKEVHHVPSLDVTYLQPSIDFSKYDYFIITSKQAVAALQYYDKEKYIKKKALCISKASANAYEAIGGNILDIAKGYGDTLISYIKQYPQTTKWLYLRASVVASDFVKHLQQQHYQIDEAIVYKTQCSLAIQDIKLPQNACLIFTSPSSVECFLESHTILPTYKVVVIGKTTAKSLPKGCEYIISQKPTIQSCIEICFSKYLLK